MKIITVLFQVIKRGTWFKGIRITTKYGSCIMHESATILTDVYAIRLCPELVVDITDRFKNMQI